MKQSELILVAVLVLLAVLMVPFASTTSGVSALSLLALWIMQVAMLLIFFFAFVFAFRGVDCNILEHIHDGHMEYTILSAAFLISVSRMIAG